MSIDYIEYRASTDGFTLKTLILPSVMTQAERNVIRHQLAREYSVPCHYIGLYATKKRKAS